jgi:16S rRNA (cytosine1402-N4)-methyltransferase
VEENTNEPQHTPVLAERVGELLAPALSDRPAVLVDATLGLGGHAEAMLAAHSQLRLVGLDRDPEALRRASERLAPFGERFTGVHAIYHELPDVLDDLGLDGVEGILFDLGVSSMQLDVVDRGFSYARDAPLDMRMDPTTGISAAEVVNTYSAGDLARILRDYGEERFANRVAKAIVTARERESLTSTARLAELVRDAIPAATRKTGGHPAKRAFQALRIEVNAELESLRAALPAAIDALRVGGRLAVMSYHSLEDRMVKRAFAAGASSTSPSDLPVELPGTEPVLRLLTRGAETPTEAELASNPRSASVRLRAVERIRETA